MPNRICGVSGTLEFITEHPESDDPWGSLPWFIILWFSMWGETFFKGKPHRDVYKSHLVLHQGKGVTLLLSKDSVLAQVSAHMKYEPSCWIWANFRMLFSRLLANISLTLSEMLWQLSFHLQISIQCHHLSTSYYFFYLNNDIRAVTRCITAIALINCLIHQLWIK